MNASSLDIDFSEAQRQKEMYKYFRGMLVDDEDSPRTIENIILCEATTGTKWSS